MKKIIYTIVSITILLLIASCGSKNNKQVLKYTTDKTIAISKINLEQLDEKFPKEEMLKDTTNRLSASEKEKFKLFMNANENGIDIVEPLYILVDQDKENFATSFIVKVDDTKKFETNFSKITETQIKIDKAKNLIYSNSELIGSINDNVLVLSRLMSNPYGSSYGSSGDAAANEEFYTNFWKRKTTENEKIIDQVNATLKEDADMSAWVNLYAGISTLSRGYIETLAVNKLLIDAGVGVDLNFEKGNVAFNTQTFFNDDLQKLVEKHYDGKNVNYDLIKNIDVDNSKMFVVGFMSFDFIKHFVKEAGFEASLNKYLEYKDITFEEITNALTGDYAFVNFKDEEVKSDDPYYYAKPNSLFALGIKGDNAKKVIDILSNDGMMNSLGGSFSNKDILVFATNQKDLNLLKTNKAAANKKLDKISGVNAYSWTDGEEISKTTTKNNNVKVVEAVTISNIKDGNLSSETTIKIDKKDKNALHYLMGYE
ncbi:hypothetical protein [Flavobacterium sp.]|uniref:hypothetical protein n=1 Tax=Flavobacterium sp. TaxID=239 RepID=UPI00374FED6B